MQEIPAVITIDGPSGVGKGTIAKRLAIELGWHYLDSGAIYRVVAWAVLNQQYDLTDVIAIKQLIKHLTIQFEVGERDAPVTVICDQKEITDTIRSEKVAQMASKISAIPAVRAALLQLQRDQRRFPGLVTDGRDMGTVVFPDANVKFYFVANPKERAKRRFRQLKQQGISVSLPSIEHEIAERDQRDSNRAIAPLRPADDAVLIDTTQMTIDQVFVEVMEKVNEVRGGFSTHLLEDK